MSKKSTKSNRRDFNNPEVEVVEPELPTPTPPIEYGYGWKFLTPAGTTESGEHGSFEYSLPRRGEEWSDITAHPEPLNHFDNTNDCGPGRLHIMLKLNARYAPQNWWPWRVRYPLSALVSKSGEKAGVRTLQLKRVTPAEFAEYIRTNDLSRANLSRANLSRADLSGTDLSGTDLSGATLSRATLSGVDLSGADLSGATLSGATLSGATLSGADLSRADLSGANLSGATLFGADLSGADLSGANLSGANLSGATLSGATLFGADLSGADLSRADLSGADLSRARNKSEAIGLSSESV